MCEICDFCGNPGLDRCIVCSRCYCEDHEGGPGYCYEDWMAVNFFE